MQSSMRSATRLANCSASHPPEEALRTWMDRFMEYMTTKLGLSDAIRAVVATGGNPFGQSREKLNVALGSLLDATAAAGVTRPEVSADDLLMTLSGLAMAAGLRISEINCGAWSTSSSRVC